jgi:hypothetical protein
MIKDADHQQQQGCRDRGTGAPSDGPVAAAHDRMAAYVANGKGYALNPQP